jgi:maleylacetoacetate isomerase
MSDMVLHGFWRSSSSHRVRIALALKEIAYTRNPIHLGRREQLSAEFLERHPSGQVPVLEVGTLRLTQSIAILQFLERQWPEPPLFPGDPILGAQVWEVVERINSFIQPLQLPGTVRRHLLSHLPGDSEVLGRGVVAFVRAQLTDSLARLEQHVGAVGGEYCVGDVLSAADVVLVPQLDGAERMGVDLAGMPRLRAVRARCMVLPAFRAAAPAAQEEAPSA